MRFSDTNVGDIVNFDGVSLLITECDRGCKGCYFDKNCKYPVACLKKERKDGKSVIFSKMEEIKPYNEEKQCFDIGEEFHYGLRRMKCVEATGGGGLFNYYCKGCFFFDECAGGNCIDSKDSCGLCMKEFRPDNKNVIFVELKENKDGK